MMDEDLADDEKRLISRYRDAKLHGYAQINVTIHEHHLTNLDVSKKEVFKLPTRLREV